MGSNANTVTCSFTMDRNTYNAYKSLVVRRGETVKGDLIRYMQYAINRETPNAETIEAIEEVEQMKANPSMGKTYDSVNEMMKELLDV